MYETMNLSHVEAMDMISAIGGFPVTHKGKVVGAIGVSGLDEEQEAELGRMALELVTRKAAR